MNRKLIGLYQLITGIFGAVLILLEAVGKSDFLKNQQFMLQIIVGILLFGLIGWSGYGLLNHAKNAKRYSMFLQAIQIPRIAIAGFMYEFSASSFFVTGLKEGHFAFNLSLSPISFTINSNAGHHSLFMVYLMPIVLLYLLSKIKGR